VFEVTKRWTGKFQLAESHKLEVLVKENHVAHCFSFLLSGKLMPDSEELFLDVGSVSLADVDLATACSKANSF